jgi:hypothetical protein
MRSETILAAYAWATRWLQSEAYRDVDVAPSMTPERFTRLLRQRGTFRAYLLHRLAEADELRRKVAAVEQMRPDDVLIHIGRTQGDPVARRLIGAGWRYTSGDGYPIGKGATPWEALGLDDWKKEACAKDRAAQELCDHERRQAEDEEATE